MKRKIMKNKPNIRNGKTCKVIGDKGTPPALVIPILI